MKALVTRLCADGVREKRMVDDWPAPPEVTGNLVRVRTLFSGVTNGTERNDLIGGNYATPSERLPATWGYQNVGVVVEVGPECRELSVGDVVYSSADHVEYAVFPEDWLLVKLPDSVDRTHAALFGMTSVAMRTCRHADLRMGERVLVVGAGFIGQLAAQIADAMGARVTICDLSAERLSDAQRLGAVEEAFVSDADGWSRCVPGGSFDAVIDVAGAPGMEDQLIGAVRARGRVLLIAGRSQVNYTFNLGQFHEVTIKQNSHFDRDDLHNVCRLTARGRLRIGPLLRAVVPASEAYEVYETLRDHPQELGGTVFRWSDSV